MIRCTGCGIWKDPSLFWRNNKRRTGRQNNCIECAKAYNKLRDRRKERRPIQGFADMDSDLFWGRVDATAIRRHQYSGRV